MCERKMSFKTDIQEQINFNIEEKTGIDMPQEEYGGSEHNLVSSTSMGEDNNIIIVEESSDPNSLAGILYVCKRKLLRPYMRFLSLMGLRPIVGETLEQHFIAKLFNFLFNLAVIFFLIIGYLLQYLSCFRRDRGFGTISPTNNSSRSQIKAIYYQTCNSSLISGLILPSLLHFAGYIYALYVFRKGDDNQLTVLIERVFIVSSQIPNIQINQKHIVRTLWIFVVASFIWMLSSICLVSYMMSEGEISFRWFESSTYQTKYLLKILLVVCIIWHDIVQASVISNYCLQVQLLKNYVQFISDKLLLQSIRPLEWIRDIEEFRKLLIYLNTQVAPAVCIFTVLNWTYAISGTLWLFASQYSETKNSIPVYTAINIFIVILWWFMAILPFIQAARLTIACDNVKTVGQEARTRPFAHQDTPLQELNSILIYTNSLKINARLFNLPINGKYTGITFAVMIIFFLVLGQSNIILIKDLEF
ncbi:uncharacterized protein GrlHz isoform X1 [Euwallacea similis]|uniref:uncharacterized protein GrlHz isoform X1 n=1 Tax=Euwallacea similis TaxID=1736056 RepID=UPI00344F5845